MNNSVSFQNYLNFILKNPEFFKNSKINKLPYKIGESLKAKDNLFRPGIDSTEVVELGSKDGNLFQRTILNPKWWAPDPSDSANESVRQGLLTEPEASKGVYNWAKDFLQSGGALTDETGELTTIGKGKKEGGDINIHTGNKDTTNWEKIVGMQGDMLKEMNEEQLKAAFIKKGIDIAGKFGEGGMRAADSYDNLTRSIAAIAGALPQYNNPAFAISPMAYQDYAFGRG